MVEVIQRKVAIMQFYKSLSQAVNIQTILSCYFKAVTVAWEQSFCKTSNYKKYKEIY